MGCQSEVYVGDNLTFSVCTHDPDTGALTDADAAPAYRIYEDETATPILTGTMALLDGSNTTGFYSEQIACTTANGFETGKSYTIYISGAVGGTTGGICYGFRTLTATPTAVWANATRTLTQSAASVTSAVSGSTITQYRGTRWSMTITIADCTGYSKLWFTVKEDQNHADTSALVQVELTAPAAGTDGLQYINKAAATTAANASITVNSGTSITVMVKGVETAKLTPGTGLYYDVKAIINSDGPDLLGEGSFTIDADTTRATS